MDDFDLFDQFGQPRKRGKERRAFVDELLGVARFDPPQATPDTAPPPAGVQRIRNHPLVPGNIPIYGYIYDVKSGKLVEVPAATAAGRAR